MLFFFYWGALLLYAMSSNHFLMACKLELYSPHIWWLLSSYFSLVFHCHVYHFGKKSLTTRRASIHPAFMGNCTAISYSLIYLVDEFIILFMVLLNKMRMLGKSKVYGANQRNEGVRWVQYFLVLPQGFSNFPSAFLWVRWHI